MTPHPSHPDVLVVDDSRMMRAVVTRGLTRAGVPEEAIVELENGARALERVHVRVPGLIVTDVHMPEMTGDELLEHLSKEGYLEHVPVVVVTSLSSARRILDFVRLGAAAVIRKPVDAEGIARELSSFVMQLTAPPEPELVPAVLPEAAPGEMIDLDQVLEVAAVGVLRAWGGDGVRRLAAIEEQVRMLFGTAIAIREPVKGVVTCWADFDAASLLAEHMGGSPAGKDDVARLDALAEFSNQLVGTFFARIAEAQGDPLHDSDFGLPQRFVVLPGTPLPAYHQVFQLRPGYCLICHVDLDSTAPSEVPA